MSDLICRKPQIIASSTNLHRLLRNDLLLLLPLQVSMLLASGHIWAMDFWQKPLATPPQRATACCHWCRGPSRWKYWERLVSECLGIKNPFPKLWMVIKWDLPIFWLWTIGWSTGRYIKAQWTHPIIGVVAQKTAVRLGWTGHGPAQNDLRAVGWSYRNSQFYDKVTQYPLVI